MNEHQLHDAATELATGRTAYSLAREVMGLRAQVAELLAQSEAVGQLCPTDYEDQDGLLCALLKIRRGEFDRTKAVRIEGYQPQADAKELANPPAAK